MSTEEKDKYFVAVKLFVEQEGALLILKDNFGAWDLPGGRIKKDEFDSPFDQIILRKISEELGVGIGLEVGAPLLFMRHERREESHGNPTVRIFAIGYPAKVKSGEAQLSSRHTEMRWVDLKNFKPQDYFTGGWLKGVEEYLLLRSGLTNKST